MSEYPKVDFFEPAELTVRRCASCESLTARLAAAEAALARIALSETGNKCWSDFAQDFLGWKSTSELWDIIKAAKAGGGE